MSTLVPFVFEGAPVRVVTRDDAPWFVLADVCRVLEIGNPSDAASRLDADEKMTLDNTEGHSGQRGGAQSFNIINESGLYALILRSRKPAARRFRKWVTAEVLPSIRKTGRYLAPGVPEQIAAVVAAMAPLNQALAEQAGMLRSLQEEIAELRVIRDPRAATTDYRAAIDVVSVLKALPRGRRTLARRAGDAMARLSAAWQVPVKLCPVTGRRMFSAEVADDWVEKEGRQRVRDHNAAAAGQGVLNLEAERRKRGKGGAATPPPPPAPAR